jgi:hypothetical protein
MAIFRITPATSRFTNAPATDAFGLPADDTPGADTLIVDPSAFLISANLANSGHGAFLAATGAWTVTVNGSIVSQTASGIFLDAGNIGVSTITIGIEGDVRGETVGIFLGSSASVKNAGTIDTEEFGGAPIRISNGGTHTIVNSGIIGNFLNPLAAIQVVAGTSNDTVKNSGTIAGSINLSDGNDTVTNSGFVMGHVQLGSGTNVLINSGSLQHVSAFSGADTVTNSGFIGGVELGEGANRLTNSGSIGAGNLDGSSYFGGSGNDTVRNSNVMEGAVHLGNGNNTLTNSGKINGPLDSGDGNDTLFNSGTINDPTHFDDLVQLGHGDNTVVNSGTIGGGVLGGDGVDTLMNFAIVADVTKSGTIVGPISLGDGNDTVVGGGNPEFVRDGNGADIVTLGGGNDSYSALGSTGGDGTDTIRAGAGSDNYFAGLATTNCAINLDTVAHDLTGISSSAALVAANTAIGTEIGTPKDAIFGFENASTGIANDVIYGSAAGNRLDASNGNDFLAGFGGNDSLNGGNGNDDLIGGSGKDQLTGGAGSDNFHYLALSDSGITTATRDLIADFEPGIDLIDLHLIDANKTTAGDDAFNFIGNNTPFAVGAAGQLHAFWTAIGQIVEGDVNGDAKPDFSIQLQDPTHAITLASTDFSL